ncbi:unnamed protein product, partial [Symbiodinium microadriaticum]
DDLWKELLPILHVISHQSLAELINHQQQSQQQQTRTLPSPRQQFKADLLTAESAQTWPSGSTGSFDTETVSTLVARHLNHNGSEKSAHTLTEKVKVSLLKCLHQLAAIDFTIYAGDPFAQPTQQPPPASPVSEQSRIDANPLTVVAPVVIFLILPFLSSCE